LKRGLTGVGLEVIEAEHGQDALEKLKAAWPVRIALVDWNMPVMNGLELVRAIRARAEWSDLLVMMVTTESEAAQLEAALAAGANEYLMKPFEPAALVQKLTLLGVVVG
jgi:two-component system chemotaxis response regulator CheY